MRKAEVALTLLLALLVSGVAGIELISSASGNPWIREDFPPDASAKPPKISLFAPLNDTTYNDTSLLLSVNVSLPESRFAEYTFLNLVDYEADWLREKVPLYYSGSIYDEVASSNPDPEHHYFQYLGNLSKLPRGNHRIVVHAYGGGSYPPIGIRVQSFYLDSTQTVFFTSGNQSPLAVTLVPIENKTFDRSNIPLNYAVGEPLSKVSYVLDNQSSVTINGNTTLSGLSVGPHNVTVYAWDLDGFDGHSETVMFWIEDSFPVIPVAASATVVAIVSAGLLVYFKKHKDRKQS